MLMNGAQAILESLRREEVDIVFGYPGGAVLDLYDAVYQAKFPHILTRHEQGAVHAADGYARATGKVGVCFATSGPGATNLITGIATANMDSIPMVCFTGQVGNPYIGKDSFQEVSITSVTMAITKHNYFVNRIEDLEPALRDAFRVANSGRKGPVLIDITKDVTAAITEFTNKEPMPLKVRPQISDKDIAEAVALINEAQKPVAYVGGGVVASGAEKELVELLEKADIPVTHTLMSAGVVGYDHDLNLGMLGMHGTIAANRAIDQCDLVIALGARFSDRVALNPGRFGHRAKIVQVDIDKSEVNKNVVIDKAVVGDVKDFLTKALPLVEETKHDEWHNRVDGWKKRSRVVESDAPLHPKEILDIISDKTDEDTIYVTDVGQHQMWSAQYLKHNKAKKFITSGGLGTMGFGYGAAIGAKMGCPGDRVVHITGDGSFHMNLNEACTAVSQNLPIITVIMNNQVLGMVYQWQTIFYDGRYSNTTPERKTDYVKLAEGFGAKGYRATTPEEFEAAMDKALKTEGPVWIECVISREERVLPMIPAGKSAEDMIID